MKLVVPGLIAALFSVCPDARAQALREPTSCAPPAAPRPPLPPPPLRPPPPPPSASPDAAADPDPNAEPAGDERLLGVLPDFTTVGARAVAPPLCTKELFALATRGAFDRNVYPFVGFRALLTHLQQRPESWDKDAEGYGKRYGVIFVDNAIGSYLTTAVMPMLVGQDPRYFVKGDGTVWGRAGYALSRLAVTRARSDGRTQFNISEIGGAAIAAGVSTSYYPSEERTVSATLWRWGSMMVWKGVSNELKEFWPDIQRKVLKR